MDNTVKEYARIKCAKCNTVVHVSADNLPEDIKPGEVFESFCPGCDRVGYMELS